MTSTITNTKRPAPSTTSSTTTAATTKPATTPPPADHDVEDLASAPTQITAAAVKRAPPATVAAAEKLVEDTLSGSPSTDDADTAALALIRLPNADYADSMKALAAQPGQLEKLLASVTPSTKDVLVRRLDHAGVLKPAPTPPARATSPKAPTPPMSPTIYKDDPTQPKALRQLAVDENVAKMPAYREQISAYRDAYGATVDGARSIAELRAIGPMAAPTAPEQLPSTKGIADQKLNAQYQHARGLDVHDFEMEDKVADKARTLSGHAVAGFSVKAEGAAMVTLSGVSKIGLDVSVGRGADGTVSGGATARGGLGSLEVGVDLVEHKLEGKLGVGDLEVTVDQDGVEVELADKGPSAYGSKPTEHKEGKGGASITKTGASVKGELGGTGGGIAIDEIKGLTVEGKFGGVTGSANFNGDSMAYGIGVEHEFGTDDFKVEIEAELEVGLQGVTKFDRDGFVSTSHVGFYDRPPELGLKSWDKLSSEKRAEYGQQVWTETEWKAAGSLILKR